MFRAGGQASLRRSVRHRRATAGSREDALESSEAATEHFPSDDFVSRARVRSASEYDALYAHSISEPQAFWSEIARGFHWETPFNDSPASCSFTDRPVTWFEGGRTNVCYNCLDRHVASGKGDVVAFHVERHARGRTSSVTYGQLLALVCQVANALVSLGVNTGDTVLIYLPQRIHTVATMLACARLGAPHCVVFAGFSAAALAQVRGCRMLRFGRQRLSSNQSRSLTRLASRPAAHRGLRAGRGCHELRRPAGRRPAAAQTCGR